MDAPNKQIIEDLQSAAQMLAHLSAQYRVDVKNIKSMGLKWLAKLVKGWYHDTECYLDKINGRLLYFGVDPDYEIGEVAGADDIEEILKRAEALVYAAHDAFCDFRKSAWDAKADYTPDIYEHSIHSLEEQAFQIERELNLLKKLTEPGYIGARLEDG